MARGELPAIYGERAAAVVVFVSAEYAARDRTRLERRAALSRAVRERREYVLPALFDDTPLAGLLPDVESPRRVQSLRKLRGRFNRPVDTWHGLNSTQEQPIVSTGRGQGSWRWWPVSHSRPS